MSGMTTLVSFSHAQSVIWLFSADFTGSLCVLVLGVMTRYGAIESGRYKMKDMTLGARRITAVMTVILTREDEIS